MEMTYKEIIDFIAQNGEMGSILTNEMIELPVLINYNEYGTPNTEMHTFKVSAITLIKEDLTQKLKNAEAVINSINIR